MHFALPPRKTSQPPPYLRPAARLPGFRRTRAKLVAIAGLVLLSLVYLIARAQTHSGSSSSSGRSHGAAPVPARTRNPSRGDRGDPPVVIVTVLDETKYTKEYLQAVRENRVQYAEKHGYKTLLATPSDYDLAEAPASWALVPAVRDALTRFPRCAYVWYLDAAGFVMNPRLKLEEDILRPAQLDKLMRRDVPVAGTDGAVKTLASLKAEDAELVLTQDGGEGLAAGSFVLRNGEWAKFFLETWFGPLYRSYKFKKAEAHALEHMLRWHSTILSRVAIVDQHVLNAYNKGAGGQEYKDGDLVVRFPSCSGKACETETRAFVQAWRRAFDAAQG
ncbi:hypothetical protein VTJ83DRAFT_6808 [Remersonia thermophila]|uniref:Alpha-1,2-galactosyltransferase n=1 Tax=Remersonia thermophila TaxID=72144 RepID=A0ABR4D5T8_9PEZI